jgi:hypothetical protein
MVATGYTGGDPRKVDRAGDTMTGDLVLPADPDQPLEAATKAYVDAVAGGGGAGVPSNTVTAETTFGVAPAAGAATTYSRGDHTHGSPAAPTAASVGADPAGSAAAAQAAAVASSLQKTANLADLTNTTTARTSLGLGGAAVLNVGTTAGTVAAGDDSRIVGALQSANNLDDLANDATARTNLGLGGAATLNVGTGAGTVAAGDDARIVGAAQTTANLSDLTDDAAARTNLGLGNSATLDVGTGADTVAAGDDSRITGALQSSQNLADLDDVGDARDNLGLGDSATRDVGTTAGTVAAGDDARFGAAVPASRQINSGTGLTGGGDLTADRTLSVVYGNTAGTAAQGNDSRLSDARTPTAHAATHAAAGSDPVTLAQSQITDLTTDLAAKINASTLTTKGDLLVRDATSPVRQGVGANGTVLTANSGTTTGVEWVAPAVVARNTETWSRDGDATVTAGAMRWYNRTGATRTIHGVWAAAGTAPTGAAVIVDVHRDGTTIFTTQGNRPTIADGGNGGALATPDVTSIADGSWLTVDIDQIGSTDPGSDITVGVVMS